MASKNPNLTVDFSSGLKGLESLSGVAGEAVRRALGDVGEEMLRLAVKEVPLDKGPLQQSGTVDRGGLSQQNPSVTVGFNKVYAARLHEHPEYSFQHGRKGKFLEDPLKQNLETFTRYIAGNMKGSL